jgi:hypothetical protein
MTEKNTSGSKIDVELSELTEAVSINPAQTFIACGGSVCGVYKN